MGVWGPGNLDSDYALDELSERGAELLNGLLLRWQRKLSWEYDEYDHTTLFVEFELVFALADKGLFPSGRTIPSPGIVRGQALAWLAGYDAYMTTQGGPWVERRAIIASTFERFAKLCESLEGTAALPSPPVPPRPSARQATPPATAKPPKKTSAKKKKPR
jgi:hypothetical protein